MGNLTVEAARINPVAKKQDEQQTTAVTKPVQQEESIHVTAAKAEQKETTKTAKATADAEKIEEPKGILANIKAWLNDKDKVCTDGKDDGNIGFIEGAKNFFKGFFGGIIKNVINHPIMSVAVIAAGAALSFVTGGAIVPLLWALGAGFSGFAVAKGLYNVATANTDAEAKAAWELAGTGTSGLALAGLTYKGMMNTAHHAGVKGNNVFEVIKNSVPQSGKNIKGNYLTWKTGAIHANSNAAHSNVQEAFQSGGKVEAYRIDTSGSVEEVLAKNPGLSYEAETGKFYVQTSWGEKSYINPDAPKGYMFVKYGTAADGTPDVNAVEGLEFSQTYVDNPKFAATGVRDYVDPTKLEFGKTVAVSKEAPASFKVVPAGTRYMSAEGEHTMQAGSVMRFDTQGRPYQSTADFMLRKVSLTPEQVEVIKPVFGQQLSQIEQSLYRYNPVTDRYDMPSHFVDMHGYYDAADFPKEIVTAAKACGCYR